MYIYIYMYICICIYGITFTIIYFMETSICTYIYQSI